MKLYFSKGSCSLAVRIAINEMGLACDYESVDLKTKQTQHGKNFLEVNPKGSVPTLVLDTGEVLTEAAVIQQYLADTAKATSLLPAMGDIKRYRVLEWLNYVATEMHKGVGVMFNPLITAEMKETIFMPIVRKKLEYLDKQLAHNDYLTGKHFTLPDGYLFVMLKWVVYFKIDIAVYPHLHRYFDRLKTRASIQQSMSEEG